MWPFKKKSPATSSVADTVQCRKADGTVLGDLIKKGVCVPNAGMKSIGRFDPACAPFRTFLNGKTGLVAGQLADQLLGMLAEPGVSNAMMMMGSSCQSGDLAVELGRRLGLRSCQAVLETFQNLAKDEAISSYLIVTTTMPFHLTYATDKVIVVAEVEHELQLNALANLLLNDAEFVRVDSPQVFRQKAAGLFELRKEEVERMKQWATARMYRGR